MTRRTLNTVIVWLMRSGMAFLIQGAKCPRVSLTPLQIGSELRMVMLVGDQAILEFIDLLLHDT